MLNLLSLLRLVCVWTLLLMPQLASARTPVDPETRVGDFEVAAEACVQLSALANSSRHQENVDASTAEAVGYPHATRGAQALGRGSTANLAKGTTVARNLREAKAIEQAMSNPAAGQHLARVTMSDARWAAGDGWVKMQQIVNSGGREGPINVHYVYNTATGAVDDFKIVLQGAR